MPFDLGPSAEELDLDELFRDVPAPAANLYIADGEKAVELISDLIQNDSKASARAIKKIRGYIDDLFALFEDVYLENELELYEQLLDLCARLAARQKIRKIQDKVVVSFGGAFSAGKSKFINSISGIEDVLPVAQKPTTSIPTYIIKAQKDELRANSVYGYATELTAEAMEALTHEFDDVYHIGFSAFVDSIIVESSRFSLPADIALLDTPGYTKYDDDKSDSKLALSDRQRAFDQLRASDHLIWLVDIGNGVLTQADISFLESLRVKTPILIVFTKADLKTEKEVRSIIAQAEETLKGTSIKAFGVTAHSAKLGKEYGRPIIRKFFASAVKSGVRGNDVLLEFDRIEEEMRERIQRSIDQSRDTARSLFAYISRSKQFLDIRSLVALWGKTNQEGYQLYNLLKRYKIIAAKVRQEIAEYVRRCD